MKNLLIILMILSYVFSSAFLESGPAGRVTIADLLMVGIIFVSSLSIVSRNFIRVPQIYVAAVPMLLIFLVSATFAFYPDRAAFELVVILFSLFGGIAIVNLLLDLPEIWLKRLFKGYVLTIGLISFLCLADFFVMPGLVSSRQLGGLQGPFRNTGQAGSFFGVHAALMLAMLISRIVPRSHIYLASTILALLALTFTLKRASLLAVVAGFVFLAFYLALSRSVRDKKIGIFVLAGMAALGLLGYILFDWALDVVPGLRWRLEYKFSAETVENFTEGFMAENIQSALSALADRPYIGVGLDNVRDIYQSHEIHSTYLGILAYGGLFGFCAYLFFMATLFRSIMIEARYKVQNEWAAFLYYLLPLLLGQMIGWGYTIHIRKREFWILVFLVAVAIAISRRLRSSETAPEPWSAHGVSR